MHDIVLLGLNHKTAHVELRESLSFSRDKTIKTLESLKLVPDIKEAVLISTCNRIEFLMRVVKKQNAIKAVKTFISETNHVPLSQFEKALYIYNGNEAVRHIYRVASSLDSMMLGEPQILGQIKEAYNLAVLKKSSGVILNRLLHKTFFVAKRIRNETGIGDHAVSISYAAIELGRKIFGSLEGKKVLLIGAGEMAELAVEHLIHNRAEDIWIANRTFERGVALSSKFKGKAIRFEEISDALKFTDIVITSTGSPDFIINHDQVRAIMRSRRNRPIFFIDIAVPRDIDPKINRLNNSYVYNIDDLKGVIEKNIEERTKEAVKGERIVDEAVIHFKQWYESLNVVPTIVDLRKKLDNIAKTEVKKTIQSLKHLSDDDCRAIYRMSDALINKILHEPIIFLKKNGCQSDKSVYIDLTRKLFNLND